MSFTMVDDLAIESSSVMRLDDKVTLGEWITFSWVSPLIKLGHDHDLADEEIPPLSRSMCTAESYDTLQSYGKSSLMMKIIRANSLDIMLDVTLTMASVVFNYASPFLIKRILDAITSPTPELRARAYVYASLAFLSSVAKAQVDVFHLWHGRRTSVRAKNQLIAAIYDKALRRKDTSGIVESKETPADKKSAKETAADKKKGKEAPKQQAADSGRVVSLMASDSTRIAFTASGLYFIVGGCLEVPVAAIFLYSLLGYSAFVGFIVMVIASPLTSMFMKRYIAVSPASLSSSTSLAHNPLRRPTDPAGSLES
jgi:ABC-type multidrug transport system fused ATPase/permease subunit